jgi:natural product precursor
MKHLSKDEMKKVIGGNNPPPEGSCTATCPGGSLSCTSDHMDCKTNKNALGIVTSISCDGSSLDC